MTKVEALHGSAAFFVAVAMGLLSMLVAAVVLWPADLATEMGAFPFVSVAFGLLRGLMAAACTWLTLQMMDHLWRCLPGPMASSFARISEKPESLALYYGLRFVAVSYMYASALG